MKITDCNVVDTNKTLIIFIARVHPGESNSSFICEGIMNKLTEKTTYILNLIRKHVFIIIPMINPDGVVNGLYRKTLEGYDLNRHWEDPEENEQPTLYTVKEYIFALSQNHKIDAIFDLHGHSSQKNSFLYGCEYPAHEADCTAKNYAIKEFMKLFSKVCPFISYLQSSLKVTKDKEGTARVVFRRQFEVEKTFTLETSMYGSDVISQDSHFTIQSLTQIGESILRSLALNSVGIKYFALTEKVDDATVNRFIKEAKQPKGSIRIHLEERSRAANTNLASTNCSNAKIATKKYISPTNKAVMQTSIMTLHLKKKYPYFTKLEDDFTAGSIPSEDVLPALKGPSTSCNDKINARNRLSSFHHYEKISKIKLRNYDFNLEMKKYHTTTVTSESSKINIGSNKSIHKITKYIGKEVPDKYMISTLKGAQEFSPLHRSRLFPIVF